MVVKLCCLMASNGYPPGVVLPQQDQAINKAIQDCQPIFPCYGARHEIMRIGSLNLRAYEGEEAWKPISGLSNPSQFLKIESAVKSPLLTDVQDTHPSSMLFSSVIAEHCTRHEKILQFLMSGATEPEGGTVDLALLSELMVLQSLRIDSQQQPSPLIYPSTYAQKPLLDFVGDLMGSSRITIHPDGRVSFNGTGTEVKDLLSVVAEFYLSKSSAKWKKQSMLVPHYSRLDSSEIRVLVDGNTLKLQATTVAPLKSPEKVKVKSPKKKSGRKVGRERDLYKKNYFHACENLMSIMVDKRRKHSKTAILSLKKSSPELPELLTRFSAGIAGTGLAVLFSVVCKLACSRVPFCTTRLFNTGLGFGLFWLSWAVNKLRDTIVYVNKNQGKLGLKEEEMMNKVDKSVKDIYFRAATLMAIAVLRFA